MIESLRAGLTTFFNYIPQLIGAIIILVVGYIIAKVLEAVVTRVLGSLGFEGWMERGGIKQFFDRAQTNHTPSSILGKLVFWFVFIIAITMAADALGIRQISVVLGQLIAFIPSIIAAILILVLATLLANFVSGIVRGATGSNILASVAQYAIIVYAVFAALTELGIAVQLTAPTFLIVLGGIVLAAAIAFGLGAQGVARQMAEEAYGKGRQTARQVSSGSDDSSSTASYGEEGPTTAQQPRRP